MTKARRPDEYILFKFKNEYAERDEENGWLFDFLDSIGGKSEEELPEFDIEIMRIYHDIFAEGEFHESFTTSASNNKDSKVSGRFSCLEEAELKLAIMGWNMKDVTSRYKKDGHEYLGRSVVKAYELSKM